MSDKNKIFWIHFGEEKTKAPAAEALTAISRKSYLEPPEWHTLVKNADTILLTAYNSEADKIYKVKDHINTSGINPLLGKNYDDLGPRFPDMSKAYSQIADSIFLDFPQTVVFAGKLEKSPFSEPHFEATQIVFQTIVSMHQGKRPVALILPENLDLSECWELISGAKNA